MKIAIVGAGVSGLVAARLLAPAHDITVLEAAPRIGGHTNTIRFREEDGTPRAVDTGFIVYNEDHYPLFTRLLRQLSVASRATTMGFSMRCDRTGLEYSGESLARLFVQPRNLFRPSFYGMIRDIVRFYRQAADQVEQSAPETTVAEFVRTHGYGDAFVRHHLVPLGAALWSCPPGRFLEFPIRFVVEFFGNPQMLQLAGRSSWRTIEGGSDCYVKPLVEPYRERIRTGCAVQSVRRDPEGVTVCAEGRETERFDEVVFACHSDQALRMLGDADAREREIVGSFPYQSNRALLHRDITVLPRSRRAWAAWNYRLPAAANGSPGEPAGVGPVRPGPEAAATVTYQMNILQGIRSSTTYCVSLNEPVAAGDVPGIDPRSILREEVYDHPVFTTQRATGRQAEVIRHNRTSFCGAYWGYGFHEDGVRSAVRVAEAFGEGMPA
jgi:predicted NAD/FAD-binding protein